MAEDVTGYGNNSADKTERKKENKGVSNLQTPAGLSIMQYILSHFYAHLKFKTGHLFRNILGVDSSFLFLIKMF